MPFVAFLQLFVAPVLVLIIRETRVSRRIYANSYLICLK
jgi:hypothetical protein